MYGIVNQAIQGLITEQYGEETWHKVKNKSGVSIDYFLSNESYDDSTTVDLAVAASEVLNVSLSEVLISFGEYWILKTGLKNYGPLMKAGGNNLEEFLENLPNFHSRVMLMFPNLTPPEFNVTERKGNSVHVHYFSERRGFADFVVGLLQGLGKMFNKQVKVTMIESRDEGHDHEVFLVEW